MQLAEIGSAYRSQRCKVVVVASESVSQGSSVMTRGDKNHAGLSSLRWSDVTALNVPSLDSPELLRWIVTARNHWHDVRYPLVNWDLTY